MMKEMYFHYIFHTYTPKRCVVTFLLTALLNLRRDRLYNKQFRAAVSQLLLEYGASTDIKILQVKIKRYSIANDLQRIWNAILIKWSYSASGAFRGFPRAKLFLALHLNFLKPQLIFDFLVLR